MSDMVIGMHPRDVVVTLASDTWQADGRTLQMSRKRARALVDHLQSALEWADENPFEGEDG